MDTEENWNVDDRLQALQETKQKLAVMEREWKTWRDQSKTLSIELITIEGLSVSKVAQLSGHHRNTLKVWLDIYNAEHKSGQKKN